MDKIKKLKTFIGLVFGKPIEERYLRQGRYEIKKGKIDFNGNKVFIDLTTKESEEYKRGYRDGYEKKGLETCCFSCSIGEPCEECLPARCSK